MKDITAKLLPDALREISRLEKELEAARADLAAAKWCDKHSVVQPCQFCPDERIVARLGEETTLRSGLTLQRDRDRVAFERATWEIGWLATELEAERWAHFGTVLAAAGLITGSRTDWRGGTHYVYSDDPEACRWCQKPIAACEVMLQTGIGADAKNYHQACYPYAERIEAAEEITRLRHQVHLAAIDLSRAEEQIENRSDETRAWCDVASEAWDFAHADHLSFLFSMIGAVAIFGETMPVPLALGESRSVARAMMKFWQRVAERTK